MDLEQHPVLGKVYAYFEKVQSLTLAVNLLFLGYGGRKQYPSITLCHS